MASRRRLPGWDLGAVALLLAAVLAFHWPLITPDLARRQSYPEGDFFNQFYAFASYEHDRLWAGEIPLWNPYLFAGRRYEPRMRQNLWMFSRKVIWSNLPVTCLTLIM